MDAQLFKKIIETFGTKPLAGSRQTFAKILMHPDDSIAIYFINADGLRDTLAVRGYTWEPKLAAWMKKVYRVEDAQEETAGYPVTAAAMSQAQ